MTRRRQIGSLLAPLILVAATRLPESGMAEGLRYLAFGYIAIDFVLQVRAGYRRRRPHWTADSWRRYLQACSVPLGALAILVLMMTAVEWRLQIVGAAGSTVRAVWASGAGVFLVIGALGLGSALNWLHEGDPSRQFELPRWLTFGRSRTA